MSRRFPLIASLSMIVTAFAGATRAAAQLADSAAYRVEGATTGAPGRLLRKALAQPHNLWRVSTDTATVRIPSDSIFPRTLVVVGGSVRMAGRVRGDLVVTGGDLTLEDGANINGRVVVLGGRFSASLFSAVRDTVLEFPRDRFDATIEGEQHVLRLTRLPASDDAGVLTLPGAFGLREASYDRVQSAGLVWGPDWMLADSDVRLTTTLGWHALLGGVDPAVHLRAPLDDAWTLDLDARRETRTNEVWITGTSSNSLSALVFGADARNYYRAWRAEALLGHTTEMTRGRIRVQGGARFERGSSLVTAVPPLFSVRPGDDPIGMSRTNPAVLAGDIASLVGIVEINYATLVPWRVRLETEVPWETVGSGTWMQNTLHGSLLLPTTRDQYYQLNAHAVATLGAVAPPRRHHFLGGTGTLTNSDMLRFGGDELLFVEQLYTFPIRALAHARMGIPKVSLRHVLAGAGVGDVGRINQEVGGRLDLFLLRVDWMYEPSSGRTGFSFAVALGP